MKRRPQRLWLRQDPAAWGARVEGVESMALSGSCHLDRDAVRAFHGALASVRERPQAIGCSRIGWRRTGMLTTIARPLPSAPVHPDKTKHAGFGSCPPQSGGTPWAKSGREMNPRPIYTAPLAVSPHEEPIPLLLYCPEQSGWHKGMWLRSGVYDGRWVSQGWRLAADLRVELRPTAWLPLSASPQVGGENKTRHQPEDRNHRPRPLTGAAFCSSAVDE